MDVVDTALNFAMANNPESYIFALVAGAATSVGPCVAPRYIAVTTISNGTAQGRFARLAAFVSGTVTTSAAIASIGSLLMHLARASSVIYWLLSAALVLSGSLALWRGGEHSCATYQHSINGCGAAFFLGAGTSMMISPCCTPVLVALGALSAPSFGASGVAGLVSAYTLGHLAPAVLLYLVASAANDLISRYRDAVATVGASVTLALGLYYAVLA
ncbi:MAG: hypothetical protein JO322_14890 [Candidatus Eremiobacteraeota bacterium]|nr:hypothetical protein [Candidatus Eremiobacteraeota bacterium]